MVDRQSVDTKLSRVQASRRTSRTVDTAVSQRYQTPDDSGSRIAESLVKLADTGNKALQSNLKRKIHEDQILQTSRAYSGLKPTDRATVAGKRAYDVVESRNSVMDINDQLMGQIQSNPDMTDEEFEEAQRSAYSPLLERYGQDSQMLEVLSSEMERSQGTLHQYRFKAQQKSQELKSADAYRGSLNTYKDASATPEQLREAIQGDLLAEGQSLRIGEAEQREMLMKQAAADAENGDPRLVQALSGLEWAKGDTRLRAARDSYDDWVSQENAGAIGSQMAAIEDGWSSGRANWQQTLAAIDSTNRRFPGTFTAAKVASIRKAGLKAQREGAEVSGLMRSSFAAMYSQDAPKLGVQGLDPKVEKKVIAGATAQIDKAGQQLLADGKLDQASLPVWRKQQLVNWSKANQTVVPEIKGAIDTLPFIDPDQFSTPGGMPAYLNDLMNVMDVMDAGTLAMYTGEKGAAFFLNYQKYKASEGDSSALQRAWKVTYDPGELSQKERHDAADSISELVQDKQPGWWTRAMDGVSQTADWESRRVSEEIQRDAELTVKAGATDIEGAIDASATQWFDRHTRLPNGTYVNGRAVEFAPVMGIKPADVPRALDHYLESNLSTFSEGYVTGDADASKFRFRYRPQSRSYVVVDDLGNTVSDPITPEEVGSAWLESKSAKAMDSGAASRASRERGDRLREQYRDTVPQGLNNGGLQWQN